MSNTDQPQQAFILLAFDFGEKRVGLAIGNNLTKTAQALTTIGYQSKKFLFEKIKNHIAQWQPGALIVGLPTYPDGQPHAAVLIYQSI